MSKTVKLKEVTKITTTVGKLRTVLNIAERLKNHKSKIGYACLRGSENIRAVLKTYETELANKSNELASIDDKGNLVKGDEQGSYAYTPANDKKLKDFMEAQNLKEVEYEPYYATSIAGFETNPSILNALNGIIVNVNIEDFY